MKNTTRANIYKHIVCASIGLLVLFTTSIFVVKNSLQTTINQLIDTATLLKDFKYPAWGQYPGTVDGSYTHALTLYDITSDNDSKPLSPILLNYTYDYSKMSFGQGNVGTIKYLNEWDLRWSEGQDDLKKTKVRSINRAAEQVYNYEYYSTAPRRFALNFNFTWQAIKSMLPRMYAEELFKFYLHDQEVLAKVVFEKFSLDESTRDNLLNDLQYGWAKPETLVEWFKLVHLPAELRSFHPKYQIMRDTIGLSQQAMEGLTNDKSILHRLSQALNGTIKCRAQGKTIGYIQCEPFCNDDQLVSLQMGTGMLTNLTLMGDINLNKLFNEFNSSYLYPVEYNGTSRTFCRPGQAYKCLDMINSIKLFNKKLFNNFTHMSKVFTYKDNYQLIATLFEVETAEPEDAKLIGKGLIKYIDYLNTYVFNSYDQDKAVIMTDSYKLMFPNYEYLVQTMDYFKSIMQSQLVAQAMLQDAKNNNIQCNDYFKADIFKGYAHLCQNESLSLDTIEGMSLFVRAYFLDTRQEFLIKTSMSRAEASEFLRYNLVDSLFADKIRFIRFDLAILLECKQPRFCSAEELLARQWGGGRQILSNLPLKYFPTGKMSILDLDIDRKLNGQDPSLAGILQQGTKVIPFQTSLKLLSGQESFLVLLNLMNYKLKADKGDELSKMIVRYTQKLALRTYFQDYFITTTTEELIAGFTSVGTQNKRNQDPFRGGAPWIQSTPSFIQLSHRPDNFDLVNTGIYDKGRLRQMVKVNEQSYSSSKYTVFAAGFEQVNETLLTDKKVYGTNMLGFHQNLQDDEDLTTYLDFIKYSATLQNLNTECKYNNIECFRYMIKNTNQRIDLGVQSQSERYSFIDPTSYISVQPITGLTLEINIKYTVYTRISSMQLYRQDGQTPEYKLFDMNVLYQRLSLDSIQEINDHKLELSVLQMITIGLTSFSVLMTIVFSLLYLKENRKKKSDAIESLMSGEIAQTTLDD